MFQAPHSHPGYLWHKKKKLSRVDSLDLSLVLSLNFLICNLGIETKGCLMHWRHRRDDPSHSPGFLIRSLSKQIDQACPLRGQH